MITLVKQCLNNHSYPKLDMSYDMGFLSGDASNGSKRVARGTKSANSKMEWKNLLQMFSLCSDVLESSQVGGLVYIV